MNHVILGLAVWVFTSVAAFAQFAISGKITDAQTGAVLPGASIALENTYQSAFSNYQGGFAIHRLKPATYSLRISFIGYEPQIKQVEVNDNVMLDIALQKSVTMADEVVVTATRANQKSPIAFTNVSKEELARQNLGQDIPFLLNMTPSVVTTSDAGAGVGYTGIRIRGSDATRVNVTINGIPYNEAESQGTYFVNMPDMASSINTLQIQRGVGTSTNGAGAFGASINIQTNTLRKEAYAEVNNSFGSFNTWKHNVMVGSGLLDGKFTFDARLSKITSDGYIDRASSDLKSFYLSGGYYGKKSTLRLNVFSGQERTYQAWNGIPEDILKTNRRYNEFTYKNQVDNYQQDHYQLIFSHELGSNWQLNAALHYTRGRGYYEEFKEGESLSNYGIQAIVIKDSVIATSDIIRRRWLDNHFYGTTFSLNYDSHSKLTANIGGGWNQYLGGHYGEVIWAQFANNSHLGDRYYNDDASKTDFNVYAKAFYQLAKPLNVFVDVQIRTIGYSFFGYNRNLENVQQDVDLQFFNPKAGVTLNVGDNGTAYASFGIGNKEPNRDDYTQSSPQSRPKAEHLRNLEVGYRIQERKFTGAINYYLMDYKNQLVLTGQINDVGEFNRTNIARSYRTGIEVEAGVQLLKGLKWGANATFSMNKIRNFREFITTYDESYSPVDTLGIMNSYKDSDIAFSPNVIASSQLTYEPIKHLSLSLLSKYVGRQYLDNTSNAARQLDAFFTNDVRLNYSLKTSFIKQIDLSLLVNNIFDVKYESNGYTFTERYTGVDPATHASYTTDPVTYNYYYPQAGTNFLVAVGFKF